MKRSTRTVARRDAPDGESAASSRLGLGPPARGGRVRARRSAGNSRSTLVVALAAAVVVLVGSGVYLVRSGASTDLGFGDEDDEVIDDGAASARGTGAGLPGRRSARSGANADDPDFEDEDAEEILAPGATRGPDGPVFTVDAESVRECLEKKLWDELRRQIVVLQETGQPVPDDVVRALVELLRNDRWSIDASLSLGHVQDAAAARLIADVAADAGAPENARVAALNALARSGNKAALETVRGLVENAGHDTKLVRAALFALAGMGGQEGVTPLLAALAAHDRDELTDAILTALGRAKEAGPILGQTLRASRDAGDAPKVELVLRALSLGGATSGPEVVRELRAMVESPLALAAFDADPVNQERLRFTAMALAAQAGGEALDAVLVLARSESGAVKACALNALRSAKGDEAAEKIAALAESQTDGPSRYAIAASLGENTSRKGTAVVHRLLDDPDASVREIASHSLAQIRDPASVPVILSRIDASKGNRTMAINYVQALGKIGVKDALPKLRGLLDGKDEFWAALGPWIRRSIEQIETGDADATRISGRTTTPATTQKTQR